MTKMLKFMKAQSKVVSPERLQKQKELFAFAESCYHGFPAKPSALAWDPKLRLIALATRNGQIRIYGKKGIEIYGQHENSEAAIIKLCFLPGKGALVSLCENNSLHFWVIQHDKGKMTLVRKNTTGLEGKLKKISMVVHDANCTNLLVGTEGGNIYVLDLASFTMTSDVIYQDVVMQNVPEDYKLNPGPVEIIAPHPIENSKILIGYQRGLIVLWDRKELCAEQTYVSSQQLESLCWNDDASEFVSSHNDGSFMVWDVLSPHAPKDGTTTVYGPYPCKPIKKISWSKNKGSSITVFEGGMPRANYGDRHTVTVMQGDEHVTFNLTSRVVDFEVTGADGEDDAVCTLVILAEEEIVFVDLSTNAWPTFENAYLSPLHSSAVTCATYLSKVEPEIIHRIQTIGKQQRSVFSTRPWPFTGGQGEGDQETHTDLYLTGHEDGTIRFWDASGVCLSLLYKMTTAPIFVGDEFAAEGNGDEEEWPPFRKVGIFDPYSDDPRLGVKKIEMCGVTGQLVVAGTAGQIIVFEIGLEEKKTSIQCVDVNLVAENDNFVWKSHSRLDIQKEPINFKAGMQPLCVVQFNPPASCTSLFLHSEWGLVAAGTAHGFALFDYVVKKNLLAKSTLSATDMANASDEGPMSRRKSLKKSLRESFRRLRRGRSQRKPPPPPQTGGKIIGDKNNTTQSAANAKSSPDDENVKPVERAIEARTQAPDYIGSMVRSLHLTKCYIASSQLMSATLWAGTNSGAIFIFTIAIPPSEKRLEVPVTVQLGKEIHLKHAAPVINVMILDAASRPLPPPLTVKRGIEPAPDNNGPHRVLITSEEQFKVFTLPQLKPYSKFKLTAHEGSRVRKLGVAEFASTKTKDYKETCLMVLTNLGDISVYSLPDARKQVMAQCIKREDISGINSVVFTRQGESLYQVSPSELLRVSLSAAHVTAPRGKIPMQKKLKDEQKIISSPLPSTKEESSTPEASYGKDDKASVTPHNTPVIKKGEDTPTTRMENGDMSLLSGDITIDSIRDHMNESKCVSEKPAESSVACVAMPTPHPGTVSLPTETVALDTAALPTASTAATETSTTTVSTIEESSTKTEGNVTVVKTSNVTIVSSQETTSVQVVETNQGDENLVVNGTAEGFSEEHRSMQAVQTTTESKTKQVKTSTEEKSSFS